MAQVATIILHFLGNDEKVKSVGHKTLHILFDTKHLSPNQMFEITLGISVFVVCKVKQISFSDL